MRCLLLSLALVAQVLLAACSDEPQKPGTLPTTPSSSPATTSASPTPDTPEEQVEAAVRAYYAELTRAAQTQETSEFKRLVTSGCPCFRVATAIDRIRRLGQATPDAAWTVNKVKVKDLDDKTAVAEVDYSVAAYAVLNDKGLVVDRYPKQRGLVDLSFVLTDRGWIVGNLFDLEG